MEPIKHDEELEQKYQDLCNTIGNAVMGLYEMGLSVDGVDGVLKHIRDTAAKEVDRAFTESMTQPIDKSIIKSVDDSVTEFDVHPDLKYSEGDRIISGGLPYVFKNGKMVRDV